MISIMISIMVRIIVRIMIRIMISSKSILWSVSWSAVSHVSPGTVCVTGEEVVFRLVDSVDRNGLPGNAGVPHLTLHWRIQTCKVGIG